MAVLFLGNTNPTNAPKVIDDVSAPTNINVKFMASGIHANRDLTVLHIGDLYKDRWDTLSQVAFWREVMKLNPESAIVNIASTRKIVGIVSMNQWKRKSEVEKDLFRDSIRSAYNLSSEESVFFTSGKSYFYKFKEVVPDIDKAIPIFEDQGVDPFFAQCVLLIESPGKLQKSNVGAYGSFQLMKGVAKNMGLKVNKKVDERKNFERSAWAAAKLFRTVCIPYAKSMLEKRGISYSTNDLWYKLLVLHVYHAGAGNVAPALDKIALNGGVDSTNAKDLILKMWQTKCANFGNASQNYSQLALAALVELDHTVYSNCGSLGCR